MRIFLMTFNRLIESLIRRMVIFIPFDGGARISWHKRLSQRRDGSKRCYSKVGKRTCRELLILRFSADQKFVYIANKGSDSLSWYSRDSETGALQFINSFFTMELMGWMDWQKYVVSEFRRSEKNLYAIGYKIIQLVGLI